MASQAGGNPLAAGGAAAAGVISGGVLGGVAGAGVALALANAGCLEDSLCVVAMVGVVGAGAAVGATFVGPILGGGAVTVVEHVRQGELPAEAETPPMPKAGTTPNGMPDATHAQAL
jgi:hypothetical protein